MRSNGHENVTCAAKKKTNAFRAVLNFLKIIHALKIKQ